MRIGQEHLSDRAVLEVGSGQGARHGSWLIYCRARLERLLPDLPNRETQSGFAQRSWALRDKAEQVGGMEIPFYELTAREPREGERSLRPIQQTRRFLKGIDAAVKREQDRI